MKVMPDWNYLEQKLNITSPGELRKSLLTHCAGLDMEAMARDVAPFLFDARESRRVIQFASTIEQAF
jgi:hypothetical protein